MCWHRVDIRSEIILSAFISTKIIEEIIEGIISGKIEGGIKAENWNLIPWKCISDEA